MSVRPWSHRFGSVRGVLVQGLFLPVITFPLLIDFPNPYFWGEGKDMGSKQDQIPTLSICLFLSRITNQNETASTHLLPAVKPHSPIPGKMRTPGQDGDPAPAV